MRNRIKKQSTTQARDENLRMPNINFERKKLKNFLKRIPRTPLLQSEHPVIKRIYDNNLVSCVCCLIMVNYFCEGYESRSISKGLFLREADPYLCSYNMN